MSVTNICHVFRHCVENVCHKHLLCFPSLSRKCLSKNVINYPLFGRKNWCKKCFLSSQYVRPTLQDCWSFCKYVPYTLVRSFFSHSLNYWICNFKEQFISLESWQYSAEFKKYGLENKLSHIIYSSNNLLIYLFTFKIIFLLNYYIFKCFCY